MNDWRNLLGSEKGIQLIANKPHLFGHIIGKEKLQPIHSEWIRYVWDSNSVRALQAFRGSYKTTSICTVGAIRWMLFHPNDRIGLIRKHVGKSADVVNTVAQAMEYAEVAELFKYRFGSYPKAKINRNGELRYTFKKTNTPEPNIRALGLDGDITGSHFDKIIADDFTTLKDRISKAERRNTKMSLMEIQTNIIDPGKGIGYIGTTWHRDDAWHYVNTLCSIAKYPVNKFGYIIGYEEVAKKKAMTTPSLYAANYDLDIIADESLLFHEPVYSTEWDYNTREASAQLDTAFDGDHYCALTIAVPTKKEGGNQYYQAVGFTYPGNVEDWENDIDRLCKRYNVKNIWVEENADKGACAKRLFKRGLGVKGYSENTNKHIKIGTYLYPAWKYIEWAPETDDEYMAQVLDYREGSRPDDAPDSAASLFREAFGTSTVAFDDETLAFFHGRG
jgi:hypothetical protein